MEFMQRPSALVVTALLELLVLSTAFAQSASRVSPLAGAHAHNDYEHPRPLLDALELGFTSVEADVFLVDGKLLVAHNRPDVDPKRSLDALYLKPLSERVSSNGGQVYPDGPPLTLLIDIKANGAETYKVLAKLLTQYRDMLSETKDGVYTERAVTIVISGDRPMQAIAASNPRFVGVDGRLEDLASSKSPSLLPLLSDNWTLHFKYLGTGDFKPAERERLHAIVRKAHAAGRRVRFWGTPESESLWQELKNADVDLIGTDDLPRLAKFLQP